MRVALLKRCKQAFHKVINGNSRGFTLVEVTVAIVVLAILVGAVIGAMIAILNMQTHQDQKRIAEYLTRNEFEYIKTQPYIWGNITAAPGWKGYPIQYDTVPFSTDEKKFSYFLDVVATPIYKGNYTDVPVIAGPRTLVDEGIQRIVISVYSDRKSGTPILVTTNYKVFR